MKTTLGYQVLKELELEGTNRPDHVALSVERRATIPKVVGSIPTVIGLNFQPA